MRFQVGICSENFQLDQIQNGRLAAIINFNMPDTGQTVPDALTFKIGIVWKIMIIKVICTLFNFSDLKNNIQSVQICINSRWQTKKQNGPIVIKVFETCTGEAK